MKRIKYLYPFYDSGLWDSAAIGRALERTGVPLERSHTSRFQWIVARALKQANVSRNLFYKNNNVYVSVLSWASDSLLFPKGLFYEIIPFVYDFWPQQQDAWLKMFRRYRIRTAFFSSKAATIFMSEKLPEVKCYWMPEAVDIKKYDSSRELYDRQIDILTYGRSPNFIEGISSHLLKTQRRYVSFSNKFIPHNELVSFIGTAKLVVCYPKSLTHPDRSGYVETVTQRYFETMASGALPIGYCPGELKELFGYNPVLEIDLSKSFDQLEDILINIRNYQELANINLQRVREVGSWDVRVRQMLAILDQQGYAIPPFS